MFLVIHQTKETEDNVSEIKLHFLRLYFDFNIPGDPKKYKGLMANFQKNANVF